MDEKFSELVKRIDDDGTENYSRRLLLVTLEIDRLNAQWEKFSKWADSYGHPSWCDVRGRVPSPCHCGLEEVLKEIPRDYVEAFERVKEDDED